MSKVNVALDPHAYDVLIEEGLLDCAGRHLRRFARDDRLIVVTDETVWAALGDRLHRGCAPVTLEPVVLAPGEATKSWPVLIELADRLLTLGLERSDHILAFGGGVIGDLAGFAAAIVNRGCGFVQIPTTLLAQVDSSVGGKTGINVAAGKNMIGTFHQPALVLIDPSCLHSLPARQLRAGYAEIVKYALVEDAELFGWLEQQGSAVLAGETEARTRAIAASVAVKARIVEDDEREKTGRRALLNLGHTFGHALEAETGFSVQLLHGEAVAVGLMLAFDFSVERGLCPAEDANRVRAHLKAAGLPASLGEVGLTGRGAALARHMLNDKKKEGGRVAFILARGIGAAFVDRGVALADTETFLDRQR